jgi:hypothetical protein
LEIIFKSAITFPGILVFHTIAPVFEGIEAFVVSRPQELPLQPLAERYVNLSIHTAPIKQTLPSFHFANGRIDLGID